MLENINLALQGVWSHKLRSFLTMLGIIIGIAAIITIVSTIRGTNEQIKQNLIGAGNDMVQVQLTQDGSTVDFSYGELPEGIRQGVRNNAGGVYNHDLYFKMLAPLPASVPSGDLERAVERDFGDLSALKAAMKAAALGQFGSGYAWLVSDCDGKLSVRKTPNQDTPLPLTPLLCCDVWEHAYYLQYQNRRGDYFDAWWLLVNWPQVSRAYGEFLERRPRCPHP